jgi:phage portal protein BeeE
VGGVSVIGGGTKVHVVGMNFSEMAIGDLTSTTESRIAMVMGVPTILLGRSGTQSDPTRANYAEAKEHLWFDTILPMLQEVADLVTMGIMPHFGGPSNVEVQFDTSKIPTLQEAALRRGTAAMGLFKGSLVSRHQAQRMAGIEEHGPDVFYRSADVAAVLPANATEEMVDAELAL